MPSLSLASELSAAYTTPSPTVVYRNLALSLVLALMLAMVFAAASQAVA